MNEAELDTLEKLLTEAIPRNRGNRAVDPDGGPSVDRPATLRALAELRPDRAIEWMLDNREAIESELDPGALSDVLHRIAERAAEEGPDGVLGKFASLLERSPDAARPESVATLLRAAGEDDGASVAERLRLAEAVLEHGGHGPQLLRVAAELAAESDEPGAAHRYLDELGRRESTPATMRYIRQRRDSLPSRGSPEVRVALLSSFTIRPLADYLDFECRLMDLCPETYVAPFDSWTEEVIDETSGLAAFDPEIAFLFVSLDDLVPELSRDAPFDLLRDRGEEAVRRVAAAAERYQQRFEGLLVVGGFYSVHPDPDGISRGKDGPSRSQWVSDLNARLFEKLEELPGTYFLDLKDELLRRSGGELDDPKMRHLGSVRFGPGLLSRTARSCARYVAPLKGLTRKCIVVDLDDTLWGGIVGEDGLHGIQIGETAPGSQYREFQEYLKSLKNRGIVLAVNSKNNESDALEVFEKRDEMVLDREDFAAMRINWEPKPRNMEELAEELNIGLDSMVFLDDNPHERSMMRQMLPQVLTPELPRDPARYRQVLADLPQLEKLVVTDEDRMRADRYRARRERQEFREESVSIEEYLDSLDVTVEIGLAEEADLQRVHQLVQRTNQFNLTTRRYDLAELRELADAPGTRLYTLRSRDRYGDHGLVCTALVRLSDDRWTIDSFMASCRVLGHGIEDAMLAAISRDARDAGADVLIGEFIETEKNRPARDFYPDHGFSRDGAESAPDDGAARWELPLVSQDVEFPEWIEVRKESAGVA